MRSPFAPSAWFAAPPSAAFRAAGVRPARAGQPSLGAHARAYGEVLGVVGAITLAGWFMPHGYRALGHVYLLAVMLLCLRVRAGALLFAAVLSSLAWNFVLVPPRLSFSVLDVSDLLMLGTYFAAALIGGQLMARVRAQERAADSERLAHALLDSVSHELKTPLAVLRSAAESLAAEGGPRQAHLTAEIRTATRRLDRLIVNLLHQTRLEAGVVAPRFDVCDVGDIIAGARRAADAALAGRAVTVELSPELPAVWADGVLLETVVVNLLLNAATHTPPGTPIAVGAWVAADPRWIVIVVADRGPGIAASEREHVFRKFHRGAAARPGGAGLGLSIVRGFVQAHGGHVVLDDNPGGGARFSLLLPAIAARPVPEE